MCVHQDQCCCIITRDGHSLTSHCLVIFIFLLFFTCLAVRYSELKSDYQVEAQKIYLHEWSITAFAIVFQLIYRTMYKKIFIGNCFGVLKVN